MKDNYNIENMNETDEENAYNRWLSKSQKNDTKIDEQLMKTLCEGNMYGWRPDGTVIVHVEALRRLCSETVVICNNINCQHKNKCQAFVGTDDLNTGLLEYINKLTPDEINKYTITEEFYVYPILKCEFCKNRETCINFGIPTEEQQCNNYIYIKEFELSFVKEKLIQYNKQIVRLISDFNNLKKRYYIIQQKQL